MASSSSSASNEVVDHPVAAPRRWPTPPPPAPVPHAVYVEELYNDPAPRRHFLRREMSFVCRTIAWGLIICLMAASFAVLMWLIFHPVFPRLHVASATLSTVVTTSTDVAAECNITFILANPNRHLTAIYDRMEISLLYPSRAVLLSQDYPPPFSQPQKTRTIIESDLSFDGVYLGSDVMKAMKQDLDRGSLSLGIRILAIVRYKSGKWKTRSQFMRAYCGGVSFGFTSSNNPGSFLNPYQECEVYLYSK
ncbi:hypothetical protein Salat_1023300 [Sesamum alatum]|uniref:Late embryogenesis abundant protein LEA-2 subgroup domain-containing protein n=1 Tax=Sesamum alatum TaxID=300844 RepID=A0AAE1YLU4_9LAMI|nr:hypothetical protein Salat_1023300 [Sesamum alatum]